MSLVEQNIPMEVGQSVILPYGQNQYTNNKMSKHMLLIFLIFIAIILTISNYIYYDWDTIELFSAFLGIFLCSVAILLCFGGMIYYIVAKDEQSNNLNGNTGEMMETSGQHVPFYKRILQYMPQVPFHRYQQPYQQPYQQLYQQPQIIPQVVTQPQYVGQAVI
jgi:hypothetical protein